MGANRPPSEGVEYRLGSSIIKAAFPKKSGPRDFSTFECPWTTATARVTGYPVTQWSPRRCIKAPQEEAAAIRTVAGTTVPSGKYDRRAPELSGTSLVFPVLHARVSARRARSRSRQFDVVVAANSTLCKGVGHGASMRLAQPGQSSGGSAGIAEYLGLYLGLSLGSFRRFLESDAKGQTEAEPHFRLAPCSLDWIYFKTPLLFHPNGVAWLPRASRVGTLRDRNGSSPAQQDAARALHDAAGVVTCTDACKHDLSMDGK
jgi:hypothetical protein